MAGIRQALLGSAVAAAIACAPMAPAAAAVHGVGPLHPFGLGRGLVGAALGLATLPIVIASAALSAVASDGPQAPAYGGAPPAYAPGYAPAPVYAPPPAYYPAPRTYYAPVPAYYARAPVYYPQPRAYYPAPRAAYAPRTYYAARPGYSGANSARVSYGSGRYAYAHR